MMNTHNVSIYPELVLYRRRIRDMMQPKASENESSFRTTTNPAPTKHPPSSIHPLRHMSEVRPHKSHPQASATERSHAVCLLTYLLMPQITSSRGDRQRMRQPDGVQIRSYDIPG
ncbi:hypothetical protein BD626DRAFT_512839 [Schizophyllum amplum]|uniref:Uncharacterized protein n=1 Tax=Schizophyllum amplum TaxID=97359 RepID=A0A550C011_9AGAR|nr:hypothetical protein BD626DRAFT_512839 [Auriculariopsis ampla]